MNAIVYAVGWLVVKFLQALPLDWVARLGRAGGAVAYALDGRHRRVALENLTQCFGQERSPDEIRALARENFRRIGESYCCAVKTAAMPWSELNARVEFVDDAAPSTALDRPGEPPVSRVFAIGHFGNFEAYARFGTFKPAYQCATTYRGLRPAALNRLLQSLRQHSGCHFFERRSEVGALKAWMSPRGRMIGFLADQHAGRSGIRSLFFGRECSTTTAPVVFALRYRLPLAVGICYRTGLARWRIEFYAPISTLEGDQPRSVEELTEAINRQFEAAIRRDPANWFWVHNRWKPDKLPAARPRRLPRPAATPSTPQPPSRV